MRQAVNTSAGDEASPKVMPAPVGGWNSTDAIADMSLQDALYMDNFFPRASDVQLRKGSVQWATVHRDVADDPGDVRTLMGYKSPTGAKKLFAAIQEGIYDITNGGAVRPAATVCTNNAWEYVNVTTAGGSYLLCCNGVDKMKLYNGASWVDLDGTSTPAITGITTSDVTNISTFKTRVILCLKNKLSFAYLPVDSIAGAASEYPLGSLFERGGHLVATESWTLDAGAGMDDYFVAITSEGEVAVFKGTDPSTAADFVLVGIFYIGAPLNKRCFVPYGGDLYVLTVGAIYPLSKALPSASINHKAQITYKIRRAYVDYVAAYGELFGWQAQVFPEAEMLIVNVPLLNDTGKNIIYSYQFVMNTITGAWCRFIGWNAECILHFDGEFYFAAHNKIYKGWTGTDDNGSAIIAKAKTAFNALGGAGNKQITMLRPMVTSSGNMDIGLGIDMDFRDDSSFSSVSSYVQTLSQWDSAVWGTSVWSGTQNVLKWRTVNGRVGWTAAIRLRVSVKGSTMYWNATNLLVKRGGLI